LLGIENLTEALHCVLAVDGPLRRPFIVADPQPMSVAGLIEAMRGAVGRSPGLLPVPLSLIESACRFAGRSEAYERLAAGSLVVDPSALIRLGWRPPVETREGLAALMTA
jgi:UDP-glucose 4-epimerase